MIFLDYFWLNGKVTEIGLREESGIYHIIMPDEADTLLPWLMGMDHMMVFARQIRHVLDLLPTQKEDLVDEFGVRQRWYDLFSQIRKEDGYSPSLKNMAYETLGTGLTGTVHRIRPYTSDGFRPDATILLQERTQILMELYQYISVNNTVTFSYKGSSITLEWDIDESPV